MYMSSSNNILSESSHHKAKVLGPFRFERWRGMSDIINVSIVYWHLRIRPFFHYLLDLFGRTIDTRFNAFLNVLDSIPGHLQNTALTSFCRDGGKLRARGSVDWHGCSGVLLQSTTRSICFLTTVVSGLLLGVVAMDIWTAFDGGVLINSTNQSPCTLLAAVSLKIDCCLVGCSFL